MSTLNLRISGNSANSLNHSILSTRTPQPKKKKTWIYVLIAFFVIGIGAAIYFLFINKGVFGAGSVQAGLDNINKEIQKVIEPELKQDENHLTNVLIVGKDTRDANKGLQNTDSIIIASYNNKTHESVLISIPRDTWVRYPNKNTAYYFRINGVYSYGLQHDKENAMDYLVKTTEDITNLKIHYWLIVDLAGFVKAVDQIGGLEINVERAFIDYNFPKDGDNGYRTIKFEAGQQHMDGKTALDFSRSRHSSGPEGSDYARARRQQKVIKAFVDKALSMDNLNLETILELKKTFDESVIYSPVSTDDIRAVLIESKSFKKESMVSIVLDPAVADFKLIVVLDKAKVGGAYTIGSREGPGKWSDVHSFISAVVKTPALYGENPSVAVYDGGVGLTESQNYSKELGGDFTWFKYNYYKTSKIFKVDDIVIFVSNEKPATIALIKKHFEDKGLKVNIVRELSGFKKRFSEDISVIIGKPAPKPTTEETLPSQQTNTTTN